jgi:hypothetical protein
MRKAVNFVEQILHLPYAYLWLPSLVFFIIVGGVHLLTRSTPQRAVSQGAEAQLASETAAAAAKPVNQRAAFRRNGNPVQVHIGTPDDKNDLDRGCVLDRSVGGMRLAVFHELDAGTILSIRPVHAEDMVPWIDLEVRSCRISTEMTGQFEVGCQYVKSPPYSIQLLFG